MVTIKTETVKNCVYLDLLQTVYFEICMYVSALKRWLYVKPPLTSDSFATAQQKKSTNQSNRSVLFIPIQTTNVTDNNTTYRTAQI